MAYSRKAVHADSAGRGWYDGRPDILESQVRAYFQRAESARSVNSTPPKTEDSRRILALIAPHAGMSYCGQTSAEAYVALWRYLYPPAATMPGASVRRVFILGPSHHKGFGGVEISAASKYETPLGDIEVDTAVTKKLKSAFEEADVPAAFTTRRTDEEEHSIELQMPYLSYVLHKPFSLRREASWSTTPAASRVSLVPIIVGFSDVESDEKISRVLQPYMANAENVFILSSDFCHWGSRFRYTYQYKRDRYPKLADSIQAMDHAGMALLEAKNLAGWEEYLATTGNTICGRHPISVGMHWWTSKLNPNRDQVAVEFVGYSQSNECESVHDSSVSYASAVVRQG